MSLIQIAKEGPVTILTLDRAETMNPLGAPGDLPRLIWQAARPGDVVVCLGAGNITAWAHALPGQIQQLAAEKAGP